MALQEVASFEHVETESVNPTIQILNPQNAAEYMRKAQAEPGFFKLICETFTITHTFTKGVTVNELDALINRISDLHKRKLFQQIRCLADKQDDQSTLLATTDVEHRMRKSWIARGEYKNGKFDILTVFATQMKKLDVAKVLATGTGALALATIGFVVNPLVGTSVLAAASMALSAIGVKNYADYCECPADVIYGPVFEYLREQNVLDISQISD
ncbi:unnamed protein product [Adineta ricciae]|uniref:Uncharacterized protein n=1 Tax=Adineta ricciae TaxID=249248 RepID=A0A815K9B7_ADIRI|nr:unnamed protein product [Adineta ricciae]CAF1392629.1 unnamed protein product [Adineta ricciae]